SPSPSARVAQASVAIGSATRGVFARGQAALECPVFDPGPRLPRTIPGARMQPFRQLDYLALDGELAEEERMVRDTVRSWVSERYLPIVMEHFEAGTFPTETIPELAQMGLFGPTIPHEYGGAGLNNVAAGLIYQEL